MKVKVTLELEVPDGFDDRGSIDLLVEDALIEFAYEHVDVDPDVLWLQHKVNWEAV